MCVYVCVFFQVLKGIAGKSESLSQDGLNSTGNHVSSENTASAKLLKWLMEELCEDGQGKESLSFKSIEDMLCA